MVPTELPLDSPSAQLCFSVLSVWLNLSRVGPTEELCRLRAAEVVHMSWRRNSLLRTGKDSSLPVYSEYILNTY